MAQTDEERAGTPSPENGDAAGETPETTGNEGADDRDTPGGKPSYEDLQAINLAQKDKVELANRLTDEVDELKRRLEASPAAPGKEGSDPRVRRLREIEDWAMKDDAVAGGLLDTRSEVSELREQVEDLLGVMSLKEQLDEITDPKLKRATKAHFIKNRKRLGDIPAARAEVERDMFKKENETLRKKIETDAKRPGKDVVRTEGREVTADALKQRKMSGREFDQEVGALEKAGRFTEARKLRLQLSRDEIEVED